MKAILLDEAKKWLEENCENQYTRMAVFGIIQSMPTVDYQKTPNEPLTLDELREMDGQPVWVKCLKPDKYTYLPVGWRILKTAITGNFGVWNGNCALIERDYGTDWLAYRRPPEGEVDGK